MRAAVVVTTAQAPAGTGGAEAVVTKPFDLRQFAETVESLLDR